MSLCRTSLLKVLEILGIRVSLQVNLHAEITYYVTYKRFLGRFMTRCSLFCLLWVGTNYMYILSLKILLATDVMALFATNVSFVYLLSWVILHEQFVGIRVSKGRLLIFYML